MSEKKKIMFLGAGKAQVPAISYAKDKYHVITVDYLPDNPGHRFSDEYYNISTYDSEQILELSKRLKIDAISSYASDPSVFSAALVSEKMGLVGSGYDAVITLSNKELFRCLLKKEGYNTPWFAVGSSAEELLENYNDETAILKPVDSSGSRGVFYVSGDADVITHFPESIKHSRCGKVILEEFIQRKGPQIHGDGFVADGQLQFLCLGDQYFSPYNRMVPFSTIVPTIYHSDVIQEASDLVKEIIKKAEFHFGGINVEIIRDIYDKLFVLDIAPRNGGNYIPQLIKHATGFDLTAAYIDGLMGKPIQYSRSKAEYDYCFQVILHADRSQEFEGIAWPKEYKGDVLESHIHFEIGDQIRSYNSAVDAIGVILIGTNDINAHQSFLKYFSHPGR